MEKISKSKAIKTVVFHKRGEQAVGIGGCAMCVAQSWPNNSICSTRKTLTPFVACTSHPSRGSRLRLRPMAKRATQWAPRPPPPPPRACWRVRTVGPTFYALWYFVLFLERAHLSVLLYWGGGGFRVFGFPQFHIFIVFLFYKIFKLFFHLDNYKKGERCQICKQIAGADGSACDPSKMNFNLVLFFCFLLH